jgi:SAM-dependent methyltransferase
MAIDPSDGDVFSPPRDVADISECYFYHVMDLPGHGVVGGEWDLRGGEETYLGGLAFEGKRVLELGTASGFLCRFMESRGAEVIGCDLPVDSFWDVVPIAGADLSVARLRFRSHIERLKNGWWFAHRIFGSKARAVYRNIYDLPLEIGPVDVATFGSILLHLRDPFQALYSALRLTRETVIVTDLHPEQSPAGVSGQGPTFGERLWRGPTARRVARRLLIGAGIVSPVARHPGAMYFIPDPNASDLGSQMFTWWSLPPEVIGRFLSVLGFEDQQVTEHFQTYKGSRVRLYTVVGRRTKPI